MIATGVRRLARHWRGLRGGALQPPPGSLSVAITTYERDQGIDRLVSTVAHDERVREVVIADDGSGVECYRRLARSLEHFRGHVRLTRNDTNVGALRNKLLVVSRCRSDWVILLDSDNSIDSRYVSTLGALWPPDEEIIYCPEFARPHFDFRNLAGTTIGLADVGPLMRRHGERYVTTLLNTGNFLLPRARYLEIVGPLSTLPIRAGDVFVAVYAWLSAGCHLQVVPGLQYAHPAHAGSNFRRYQHEVKPLMLTLRERIARGVPIDLAELASWRAAGDDSSCRT